MVSAMIRRHFPLILLLLLIPVLLFAHPHIWIESSVLPVLGPGGLEAVEVIWTFDDFNSSSLAAKFDTDQDGLLNASETARAGAESFSHLIDREYYLVIDVDGLLGTPLEAEGFSAVIEDGRLTYSFRSPLEIPIRWRDMDKVALFLFDPTYFIDFRTAGPESLTLTWENRTAAFVKAERELVTQGYGKVIVKGLVSQAGSKGLQAGASARRSISSLIRDSSFELQNRLASFTRMVVDERNPLAFIASMGLAVIFGLIHVLGPGHGKMFTFAYFSSRNATLKEGLVLSGLINVLDSISAFILVGITYGILSLTIQNTGATVGRITRIVAYSAIILLSLGSVFSHIKGKHEGHGKKGSTGLKPWMMALTVGLIPCPVSSALLAYGIAEGAVTFSLLLVAGVSLGGMISMTVYSFAIIGGKTGLTHILHKRGFDKALHWFEIASMLLLGVAAAALLAGMIWFPIA
jgi:ABC-type uncharacterized transport system substrate-binding protein/ABC-type nickel/cobalt efflux system permease component RcnA